MSATTAGASMILRAKIRSVAPGVNVVFSDRNKRDFVLFNNRSRLVPITTSGKIFQQQV
jgi:hypothetical protein